MEHRALAVVEAIAHFQTDFGPRAVTRDSVLFLLQVRGDGLELVQAGHAVMLAMQLGFVLEEDEGRLLQLTPDGRARVQEAA